jgi:general secretion pathway protein G
MRLLLMLTFIVAMLFVATAGAVVPRLESSKTDRARGLDFAHIAQGLDAFHLRFGRLPTEEEGLRALVTNGIFERMPRDPWGDDYRYQLHDGGVRVWSLGKNAAVGGEGPDQDLEIWVLSGVATIPICPGSLSPDSCPPSAPARAR